jgi:prevent-host-death family protein
MNSIWQIQDAKDKLSEVVARALKQGPQVITRHGQKTVVVVSYVEYKKLRKSQVKFSEFFRSSPLVGLGIDVTRDKSLPRKGIEL